MMLVNCNKHSHMLLNLDHIHFTSSCCLVSCVSSCLCLFPGWHRSRPANHLLSRSRQTVSTCWLMEREHQVWPATLQLTASHVGELIPDCCHRCLAGTFPQHTWRDRAVVNEFLCYYGLKRLQCEEPAVEMIVWIGPRLKLLGNTAARLHTETLNECDDDTAGVHFLFGLLDIFDLCC